VPSLLVLKLLLVPALVVWVTLAVRRWGPAVGGWLSGLPIVAGPVLVFYAIEQGTQFAADAAQATLAGMSATAAFSLAYARVCRRLPWWAAVAVSWSAFAAATLVLYAWRPGVFIGLMLTTSVAVLGRRMLPPAEPVPQPASAPPGDLIVRLVTSAAMVLVLTAAADRLGPTLSGLLTAFPVLTTTIAVFTHVQRGAAATIEFFRGFLPAIIGFSTFCFAFALLLQPLGTALGLLGALAAQLLVHGALLFRLKPEATPAAPARM
jgi:hypothetical protein